MAEAPELHPLDQIAAFDGPTRQKLADYWITSAEEYITTARSSNAQYGSGLKALAALLFQNDDARARALFDAAMAVAPAASSFEVMAEMDVGDGLLMDGLQDLEASSFAPPTNLPTEVEPPKGLPAPANQGKRNSCVAFSLAAIYQALSGDPTDLSEQFLYWACKSKDNIAGDVGTNPALAMQIMQETGICTEAAWPYDDTVRNENPGHGPPPAQAVEEAKLRRITGAKQVPGKDFRQLKASLAAGKGLLIGMPIWEYWTSAWQARGIGRMRRNLPGERKGGGHAMAVLGYRDDPTVPGGGYFVVRNSWGDTWAKDNPDGAGYCHMPYKLIYEQCLVAFEIDGVIKPGGSGPVGGATGAAKATLSKGKRTLGSSAEDDEQGSLYGDLRELQGRLGALMSIHDAVRDEMKEIQKRLNSLINREENNR
jgi:hypothetical protein